MSEVKSGREGIVGFATKIATCTAGALTG